MTIEVLPLESVRRIVASTLLDFDTVDARIGAIELRPHQCRAASRLLTIIDRYGGALLAEPVGVGKTFTALAVASRAGDSVLVVTPAALRQMWIDAAQRCAVAVDVITHEALSRGRKPPNVPGFVIVDEAHRVRSAATQRYERLAELCQNARVLLVTATPIQNAARDLVAQLALFLGRAARAMTEEQLAEYVVRDADASLIARPRLEGPHRVELSVDDDCLDLLLALPPPVPAKDESLAVALLTYGLVHQWTSSRGALAAALSRRRSRGLALMSALEAGRRPSRAELKAWTHAGDALQLAFPEIVAHEAVSHDVDFGEMLIALDRHGAAVEALLRHLRTSADPDVARADALRRIRRTHPGERIIAFCQYAETVNVLRSQLARDAGIAALTASGARVAGGKLRRSDVLAQFTPSERPMTSEALRIDLLITTDLLSEGLNLQEASVIVHLDLPWNPARLDQRVGRALRLGSRHDTVTVYAIAPPASAERLLRIEARLRDKLSVAQRTVGVAGRILPSPLGTMDASSGLAEQRSAFDHELRRWGAGRRERREQSSAVAVAAARSVRNGFLAVVHGSAGAMLVADVGDGIDVSTSAVSIAIAACDGDEIVVDQTQLLEAHAAVLRWVATKRGSDALNLNAANSARARRAALTRVAQTLARSPRHARVRLAPLADAARAVASVQLGEGAERVLELLVRSNLPDEAWLRSIAAFGELNSRRAPTETPETDAMNVVAIILFGSR
jgi:superfamily II DNA or RNA helicase